MSSWLFICLLWLTVTCPFFALVNHLLCQLLFYFTVIYPSFALVNLLLQLLLFFFGLDSIKATNLANLKSQMIWVSTDIIPEDGALVWPSIVLITCKLDVTGDHNQGNAIHTLSNSPDDVLNICKPIKIIQKPFPSLLVSLIPSCINMFNSPSQVSSDATICSVN